jgi:hypothetical protein
MARSKSSMAPLDPDLKRQLWNLHDVFLNASLVKKAMLDAPLVTDPVLFSASPRGRYERLWVALLAVLVEAWHSRKMRPARDYVRSVVALDELVKLLRQSRKDGTHDKLVACRHYMFHRDERDYMDIGRMGPIGAAHFTFRLHEEFSKVLFAAVQAANASAESPADGAS